MPRVLFSNRISACFLHPIVLSAKQECFWAVCASNTGGNWLSNVTLDIWASVRFSRDARKLSWTKVTRSHVRSTQHHDVASRDAGLKGDQVHSVRAAAAAGRLSSTEDAMRCVVVAVGMCTNGRATWRYQPGIRHAELQAISRFRERAHHDRGKSADVDRTTSCCSTGQVPRRQDRSHDTKPPWRAGCGVAPGKDSGRSGAACRSVGHPCIRSVRWGQDTGSTTDDIWWIIEVGNHEVVGGQWQLVGGWSTEQAEILGRGARKQRSRSNWRRVSRGSR